MSTTPQEPATSPAPHALSELQRLIDDELPALTREHTPLALHTELQRLREAFASPPALAGKTVVALGGSFSAGKSSLINALLGTRLMPTDVTPTTAVPTYAMHGAGSRIQALDLEGTPRELSKEQLHSLTHSGSGSGGLHVIYAQQPDFPWDSLALLDTPGYTNSGSADASIARTWLGSAHAIIWCVPADAGTISETDLPFLATLRKETPLAIAITKIDKKPAEDIQAIAALVEKTLQQHGFAPQSIWRISARQPQSLKDMKAWLEKNNTNPMHAAALGLIRNIREHLCSTAQSDAWNPRLESLLEQYSKAATNTVQSIQNLKNAIPPASGTLPKEQTTLIGELQAMQHAYEQARNNARRKKEKNIAELERLKAYFRL